MRMLIFLIVLFTFVGCKHQSENDELMVNPDTGLLSNTVPLSKSLLICESGRSSLEGCWITPDCLSSPPFSSRTVISFDSSGFIRNTSIRFNDSNCLTAPVVVNDLTINSKMARNYSVDDSLTTEEGLDATIVVTEVIRPDSTPKYFTYYVKEDEDICFSTGTFEIGKGSFTFEIFDEIPTKLDLDNCFQRYDFSE